jgi:D-alanyl-D-alanine carboxypeptidase
MACLVVLVPAVVRAAPFAAVVMDARTGEVLRSTNADTRLHPASLTKMMTLYIAFEAVKRGEITLDTMVTVSAKAAAEPPSKLGLRPGQRIALRHLIRAAAIRSANDAATAIGEAIEGSEAAFARRMNRTAQALGMTRTTFRNMHGLTQDGHMSTARDMTILGRRLLFDHPEYYNIFSRRSADAGIAQVVNTNRRFLDSYAGADGIKTGYTRAAGYNLTASAERGNKRIIVTVFGGTSTAQRNARVSELMDAGFRAAPNRARTVRPAAPDYSVSEDEVLMSSAGANAVPAGRTLRVTRAVAKSPRPMLRPERGAPEAAAMVASLQPEIDAAVAAVQAAAAEAEAMAVANAAAEAMVVAQAALAEASAMDEPSEEAEVLTASVLPARRPPPRPEREVPATDVPAPETPAEATLLAETPEAVPDPAPIAEVAAIVPDPQTDAPDEDRAEQAVLAAAAASMPPSRPERLETQQPDVAALADPAAEQAETELAMIDMPMPVDDAPLDLPGLALVAPPQPVRDTSARSDGIVLASVRPDAVIPPAPETEVVTRLSTSGGRHASLSIGRYSTRDAAERALLRAALAEFGTLDTAQRRVRQTGGAWEANFQGLSPDLAGLACRRLQARGIACEPQAPG